MCVPYSGSTNIVKMILYTINNNSNIYISNEYNKVMREYIHCI